MKECKACNEPIRVGEKVIEFFHGDQVYHDECCPVMSGSIEDFGGRTLIADESYINPFYQECGAYLDPGEKCDCKKDNQNSKTETKEKE